MDRGKCKGKDRLLGAASKLTQERPFDDITIDDIIKEAELSRPAFYYHFTGGKEELRAELIKGGLLEAAPSTDTRIAILEAAVRLFARVGISATTLDDIAAEAGVTRGAISWHFHSKDDLLTAIIKQYGPHAMLSSVKAQFEQERQNGVLIDPETYFHRIAEAAYDWFTSQSDLTRLAVLIVYTHPEAARFIAHMIAEGRQQMSDYMQAWQEQGYFRKDIDPSICVKVMVITFAMRAIGRELMFPLGQMPREEFIDQLVSLLLYGIVVREQPGSV
ncbi:MAG: TetR family transcriptional regulator [Ktedonobacteraceae bacterium]